MGGNIRFGAIINTGGGDRIETAEKDANGIVRVKKDKDADIGIILEAHQLFDTDGFGGIFGRSNIQSDIKTGIGYFGAFKIGGDNIIDGFGGGLMVGTGKVTSIEIDGKKTGVILMLGSAG